jgi:TonB-dependent receptor
MTVTYVGFSPLTKQVTVTAGQVAQVDATLKVASANEEIVVTAERAHGEAEAINRERASDNILQVLPVEVITSLPNTNIADALGRLPSVTLERDEGEGKYVQIRGTEPRLSNVTIDGVNVPSPEGDVRQIKLDIIPSNLVDSVEINKTLSANQDGDAIGGSVNLVTKTAAERPSFYVNAIGGYTPILNGRGLSEVDSTIGQRFGENKRLGILLGASYDWNGRGIDDVEPVPTAIQCNSGPVGCENPSANPPFFPTYSTEDIREYRYYRTRYGASGSIDYKLGNTSGVYLRFLYSHFDNFGDRWVYSPTLNSGSDASGNPTSGWLTPSLSDSNGSMSFNAQIRRPVQVIGSLEGGGRHDLNQWLVEYDLSIARAATEDHGYSSADFSGPGGIQFAIDTSNAYKPKLVPTSGFSSVYDPSTYALADLDINRTYSPQLNLQGAFSGARNYMAGNQFGTFEFGAKLRTAHKFQDAFHPAYNVVSSTPPAMASFLGGFTNPNYYDKSYSLGPTVDYNKVMAFFNANVNNSGVFQLDSTGTVLNTYSSDYDLVERIAAGYVMNTLQFGRMRLQTGLRFEDTNENLLGNQVGLDGNGNPTFSPLHRSASYLDPLPSVQVRFALWHDSAIRAVYGRGIARPNFSDLPPTFDVTNVIPNQPNGQSVGFGNPYLKPTHANNYDLLYEQYLKPLGIIQAGFFYKQLSDPIYESVKSVITSQTAQQNPLLAPYVGDFLSQPVNGANAHLYGFEIAYQQQLSFLPGLLSGVGIAANYGYTNSQTDGVPLRSDRPALLRQAPNSWNISPTYDRGRLSARLGISHNDANIFSYNYSNLNADGTPNPVPLGIKGPNGDTYLYAHTQVDAQGTFRMYRGLQFLVAGLNLTNEVFGFYNGSPRYPIQREYYKPSYEFGLRYSFSGREK